MTLDKRRLLELLAASDDGCTDALLTAHGFMVELVVGLVRAGLATSKAEQTFAAGRAIDVTRVRITEAGRRALEPEFSTSSDTGRILVTVLGMVAEMERRFILERQRTGIEAAKAIGKYKGRKPSVDASQVQALKAAGKGPAEIARELKISRQSVYRALG